MSEATDQPTLLQAAREYVTAFDSGSEEAVDTTVDALIIAAQREEIEQVKENAPTYQQVEWKRAKEAFDDRLATVHHVYDAGSPLVDLVELAGRLATIAMSQADRAYLDCQEHSASPVSARHAATHGTETQPVYSPEELTQASIDLLRAVEKSAALQDQLTTRVLQIERYLAGGDTGVESTAGEPELHVRIAHVHTLKEGWRCNETSVHWTGRGPKPDRYLLRAAMQVAFDEGRDEADRRNHPEAELESDAPTAVAS